MPPRAYHHGDLRRALLAEAERGLREHGVESLSLRELARKVGVSHAAPRRHFSNRQALLDALAETGFTRLSADLRRAVKRAGDEFEPRLRATAGAYVRFATRNAALLEVMFAGKHGQPSGPIQEAAAGALAVLLELTEQGQSEGILGAGDPGRVGLVLFAFIQGIATVVSAGIVGAGGSDELVTDAIALLTR